MNIKLSTKNELIQRSKELETDFNNTRDELSNYIESTHAIIEEKTKHMDELSSEYKEIMAEIEKRDGNSTAR